MDAFCRQENHSDDLGFSSRESKSSGNKLNVNNYYENLRCNVMTLLGCSQPVPAPTSGLAMPPSSGHYLMTSSSDQEHQQNFDSYLSKLQTMCSPAV